MLTSELCFTPWTEEELKSGTLVEYLWKLDLKISSEELWPYLCDSNSINKFVEGIPITYTEEKGLLKGISGEGKMQMEWIEYPWEWVYGKWLLRKRKYLKGPVTYNRMGAIVEKKDGGSTLYIYLGSICPVAKLEQPLREYYEKLEAKYIEYFKNIENKKVASFPTAYPISEEGKAALESIKLKFDEFNFSKDLVNKFVDYILNQDEDKLYRLKVLKIAEELNVNCHKLLVMCLYGVKLGLLELSWDVICPHCKGVRQEIPYLSQIPQKGFCEVCKIDFENNKEDSIEVVFHIHPQIRKVNKIYFCAAEPSFKPHIKIQKNLGKKEHLEADVPKNEYRSRIVGDPELSKYLISVDKKDNEDKAHVNIDAINPDNGNHLFVFEDEKNSLKYILKPSELFNCQVFRELYKDEEIPYDLNMEMGLQTLMFIDMAHSSHFYEKHGDAKAFNLVKEYFKNIIRKLDELEGVIVKTVGDGALLAFSNPVGALKAALTLSEFSENYLGTPDFHVKISISYGKCIGVNFDNKIDYFGLIVNIASKLQLGALPGDIVMSKEMYDLPEIQVFLNKNHIDVNTLVVVHNSLTRPLDVIKIVKK